MINRLPTDQVDTRKNSRVKENKKLSWHVKSFNLNGRGRIHNISTSGMLLETNSTYNPINGDVFTFDSDLGFDNFIPQHGRLVWFKKRDARQSQYLCGIEFIEPAEYILSKLQERVQKQLLRFNQSSVFLRWLRRICFAVLMGLTATMIWLAGVIYQDMQQTNAQMKNVVEQQVVLTQRYTQLYRETELQLASVTNELETTQKDLETTKSILTQTETMLQESEQNNIKLESELTAFKEFHQKQLAEVKGELEQKIVSLQEQNVQLDTELRNLQVQLDYLNGNVVDMEQGKTWIADYKQRLRNVKVKLDQFKRQAAEARIVAIRERDKIETALGNGGFMVREGRIVTVDQESYDAVVSGSWDPQQVPQTETNINIDVKIVE